MAKINKLTKEFILSLPKIVTKEGCWLPNNGTTSGKHRTWYNNKNLDIHRLVAYLWHGGFSINIIYDAIICHKCENDTYTKTVCFNPDHLYVGNGYKNNKDSVRRGTHVQTRKTHCPSGHQYDKIKETWRGLERICAFCENRKARVRYLKKKLEKQGGVK